MEGARGHRAERARSPVPSVRRGFLLPAQGLQELGVLLQALELRAVAQGLVEILVEAGVRLPGFLELLQGDVLVAVQVFHETEGEVSGGMARRVARGLLSLGQR